MPTLNLLGCNGGSLHDSQYDSGSTSDYSLDSTKHGSDTSISTAASRGSLLSKEFLGSASPESAPSTKRFSGNLRPMAVQFFKTKKCPKVLLGKCRMGSSCQFAHSDNELQPSPDLRKTRLCPLLKQSECQRGADCHFAHSEDELRATTVFEKTRICEKFRLGECKRGDVCRFAHSESELRAVSGFKKIAEVAAKDAAEIKSKPTVGEIEIDSPSPSAGCKSPSFSSTKCVGQSLRGAVYSNVSGAVFSKQPMKMNRRDVGPTSYPMMGGNHQSYDSSEYADLPMAIAEREELSIFDFLGLPLNSICGDLLHHGRVYCALIYGSEIVDAACQRTRDTVFPLLPFVSESDLRMVAPSSYDE